MSDQKTISADDRLRAFALFTMAKQHSEQAEKFADGLAKVLGLQGRNDLGSLADAIWSDWCSFDEALARDGFVAEGDQPKAAGQPHD